MQIAEQRGIHAFGQSSDMIKFGPHAQLTADTDYWGGYYTKRAQDVLDGKWKSEDTWGGLDSGMVVMAPYTNMPDDVKTMAMATEAAIKGGDTASLQVPDRRPGRQDRRVQGRRPPRSRPDPEHELLRQRHRRQGSGEVSPKQPLSYGNEDGRVSPGHLFSSLVHCAVPNSIGMGSVSADFNFFLNLFP